MRIAENGIELDAEVLVEQDDAGQLSFTMASHSGASGGRPRRNPQYSEALRVILTRLAARKATLTDALVVSSSALKDWPAPEERRLVNGVTFPVALQFQDPVELRTKLTEAMRATAREPSLGPGGNNRRRVQFLVDVPGVSTAVDLAAILADDDAPAPPPPTAPGILDPAPGPSTPPAPSSGPRRQGYMADARRRKAIEDRAMDAARADYEALGFTVIDVSGNSPYDLHCVDPDGVEIRVEVKGTTGSGKTIILTIGEVNHAHAHPGGVDLYVLHGITLTDGPDGPKGNGGTRVWTRPWDVDSGTLAATRFDWTA